MSVKIERKQWNDVTILSFLGEVDAYNLQGLQDRVDHLIEQGYTKLVLNLRLLTFINSSALGYLIALQKNLQAQGSDIAIVRPSKAVRMSMTALGLHELFPMFETDEEGVLYFHKGAEVDQIHIDGLPAEAVDRPEANAILFRLLDEEGKDVLGPRPLVAKISSLYEDGLTFRWEVPAAGAPLTTDNFDELVSPGRAMHVKFRQPLLAKKKFFEAEVGALKTDREVSDEGVTNGTVRVGYTTIDPEDKKLLDDFVKMLDGYRGEVK